MKTGVTMTTNETERLKSEFAALTDIGKALTSTLDRKEVLYLIMEKLRSLLNPTYWSLLLVDKKKDDLFFEIAVNPSKKNLSDKRVKIGEGIVGWVASTKEPLLIADVSKDARFCKEIDSDLCTETSSIICVPLKYNDKVTGVIELVNAEDDAPFSEMDLELLSIFADFAAIGLENAHNFDTIRELAVTDELTELFNAKHILDLLDYEIERARRFSYPLSFVFLDLDHFKEVNDTYGHLVGSRLLSEMGQIIKKFMRKSDMAARYGGDEFVIVLPNTTKDGALTFTNKLRKTLNANRFLSDKGLGLKITASFGVATFPDDAESKLELVQRADKAMYSVKQENRDGIRSA